MFMPPAETAAEKARAEAEAEAAKRKGGPVKLKPSERLAQNKVLFDAAKSEDMDKLEASIAAGADVDGGNPDMVS